MLRDAGGSRFNTAVGYGLTASLFIFGWIVLGTMLLLREIFGEGEAPPVPQPAPEKKAA